MDWTRWDRQASHRGAGKGPYAIGCAANVQARTDKAGQARPAWASRGQDRNGGVRQASSGSRGMAALGPACRRVGALGRPREARFGKVWTRPDCYGWLSRNRGAWQAWTADRPGDDRTEWARQAWQRPAGLCSAGLGWVASGVVSLAWCGQSRIGPVARATDSQARIGTVRLGKAACVGKGQARHGAGQGIAGEASRGTPWSGKARLGEAGVERLRVTGTRSVRPGAVWQRRRGKAAIGSGRPVSVRRGLAAQAWSGKSWLGRASHGCVDTGLAGGAWRGVTSRVRDRKCCARHRKADLGQVAKLPRSHVENS